jgi:adenine-specific DNA-methyltransferase
MDKLKMETTNMTQKNIENIEKLFPNVITEMKDEKGKIKKGINFELLKQELSNELVEGEECYDFTWVGKRAAIVEGNTPVRKTLRPCIEESKGWENTGNLYIEGDNLDVLKLLQESYLNSIKMIYIDPPYNTGNDFIYNDNFTLNKEDYEDEIEYRDEEGNIQFKQNNESNPRFHSDWCSMMYPRLKLAHNLLSEDGVIFISIDDNEVDNLKKICNEVFGEENFLECLIWKKRATPPNDRNIGRIHEFILVYTKDIKQVSLGLLKRNKKSKLRYSNPDNDYRGPWVASDLSANGKGGRLVKSCIYPIKNPITGKEFYPSEGRCWLFNKEKMNVFISEGRIGFRENTGAPYLKRYLSEVRDGLTLPTLLTEFGYSSTSAAEIDKIFKKKGVFEYAKPTTLMMPLIRVGAFKEDSIILDFFSGSATIAHAVMQLNSEDGGNRKYIMAQLPELTDEKSEAFKAGYKNICEIGKERIRRAGEKIKTEMEKEQLKLGEEPKKVPDIGFRVLKVDSTNMKDVYYAANEYTQDMIPGLVSNIKEDRTDLDLLYGVMLDWGLPLSLSHKIEEVEGVSIHTVDEGSLVACFAKEVSEKVVREIAKRQPLRVVFRDSSFANSPDKINVEEIFKLLAPDTTVKVI